MDVKGLKGVSVCLREIARQRDRDTETDGDMRSHNRVTAHLGNW